MTIEYFHGVFLNEIKPWDGVVGDGGGNDVIRYDTFISGGNVIRQMS